MKRMVVMDAEGRFTVEIDDMNCYLTPSAECGMEFLEADGFDNYAMFDTLEELRDNIELKKFIAKCFEEGYTAFEIGDNSNGDWAFTIDIIEDYIESYDELVKTIIENLLDLAD